MRRLVSISNLNDRAFHWWSQPSPLYRGTWDTATEAETGLYAARVSFLPLMACVTYAFLAVRQKYEDTPWLADFYDQTKWPHPKDWLDRVARSSVFNLSVPRIGGIIKWSKASYLTHMIPQLAKANAPIVIYWGSSDESQIIFREIKYSSSKALSPELRTLLPLQCLPPASLHDKLLGIARNPGPSDQTLLPHVRWTRRLLCWEPIFPAYMTEDEREVVNKTSAYHPTSPPHHVQGPVLEHHEASSPLPAVDPAPIPVVHISPWDFIKEREERYQQLRQSASSVECQRWASRHHSAREESIGDRMIHGHKYFKWDLEEDFWRRISLTTQDARDDFEDYAKTQRFFDPVTSTWELCFQLDTDAIPLSFEEEDDDDYQSFPTIPSQPLHPEQPQPQPHAIDEAALSADLDEALQIDQTRQARENRQGSDLSLPVIESPVLAVAIFNGLVLKEEASANAAPGPWPANEESLRKKICRIVGTLFTRDGTQWPLLPHERSSLKVFVDALLNGKLPLQCDLAPSSSQRLQSPKLRGFNLARLSTASYLLTQDISSSSCLPVAGCSYDGIVVHDPSAVVWLTRHMQHHPTSDRYTIQSLAELLLRHGCSFNLAVSRPNTFRGAHQAATNHGVFACRPHGYVGDRDDYLAYCEARDVLLASKGRAALLHGGLAWRLSMDFHGDFHSAIEAVLSPPADLDRWLGEYNGRHWWDEGLSPLAQNLLCGVYEVGDSEYPCLTLLIVYKYPTQMAPRIPPTPIPPGGQNFRGRGERPVSTFIDGPATQNPGTLVCDLAWKMMNGASASPCRGRVVGTSVSPTTPEKSWPSMRFYVLPGSAVASEFALLFSCLYD